MQRTRLVLVSIALLVSLLGITAFAGVPTVSAHATQHNRPLVTCSGNGCNGLNPQLTGCSADAYTVQTAVLPQFYVQLRYSPTCGTNWGRILSRIGIAPLVIQTQRIDGLTYTFSGSFTLAFSAMVYAPTVRARACGRIDQDSPFECTAFV